MTSNSEIYFNLLGGKILLTEEVMGVKYVND